MPEPATARKPDLTSVRTLIKSVSKLARHLKISPNGIYRWISVNRIPGAHVVKVANYYDVEIRDLVHLTGSDKSNSINVVLKPRMVLATLMEVFQGRLTLDQALDLTGCSRISLKLILTHWGDELPTLYTTLEQLDQKRIDLDEACRRLKVTKYTLHGIRRKYGYAPGPIKRSRPLPTLGKRREEGKEIALQCVAGRTTVCEASSIYGVSERTIFRWIDAISPLKMMELSGWPKVFREALAEELGSEMPKYIQKWVNFSKEHRLFTGNQRKYPETPESWKSLPIKRLLVGVLMGEASLEEVAASRGADPKVLRNLFTGDLRPMELTFEEVEGLPNTHHLALVEILLAILDRKRKVAE